MQKEIFMVDESQPQILRASSRGVEISRQRVPSLIEDIQKKLIDKDTPEKRRTELEKERDSLVKEAEELNIVRWRDIRYGVLKKLKENKWDDVYPVLMDYAKGKEDVTRGINIGLPNREKYHGIVQAAIEMAALEVSTQGMRRRGKNPDFEKWLAKHGKTPAELAEDLETVERGKILDFGGVDLPDLVGESIEEEERPLEKALATIKPREEMVLRRPPKKDGRKESVKPEEWDKLDEDERGLVISIIKAYTKQAVDAVGINNDNIYPYDHRFTVESAVADLKEEEEGFRERYLQKFGSEENFPDRAKIALGRMSKIREWFEGTGATLKTAGLITSNYHDGLAAMASAVRTKPRYDATSTDLHKMFTSLSEIPEEWKVDGEWKLGKEIVDKQDQIFAIMRGIAAAHRHIGRNGGKKIVNQFKRTEEGEVTNVNDYKVEEKQIEFIERVFAKTEKVKVNSDTLKKWSETLKETPLLLRGVYLTIDGKERALNKELLELLQQKLLQHLIDKPKEDFSFFKTERVAAISKVLNGKQAVEELSGIFDNEADDKEQVVLVGKEYEITKGILRRSRLRGKTVWIDGVQWPVTEAALEQLKMRVGSGDKIFVGKPEVVTKKNYEDIRGMAGKKQRVALLKEIPRSLDNLFVMNQSPQRVEFTKQKLAVMLNMGKGKDGLWERLKDPGADVDALTTEFNDTWEEYRGRGGDLLDQHIIDMARISLLYYCEGAELGWGFEYQEDKDMGTIKRIVDGGSTKAATDIATPFHWLRAEASMKWKDWTRGMLPMEKETARQILDHEPGWAPGLDSDGNWRISFLGKPLDLSVPIKFNLNMLNSASFEEGEYKDKKAMDLVLQGRKMSEIPWTNLADHAPYRWQITIAQAAYAVTLLSRVPDRETLERFFGEGQEVPRKVDTNELMKRMALAQRDSGVDADEEVASILPLAASLNLAWQENMLSSSREPGMFLVGDVRRPAKNTAITLRGFAPRGKSEIGRAMAIRFNKHIDQLIQTGRGLTKKMFREI